MLFFIGTHAQKACNRSLRDRLQAYRMATAICGSAAENADNVVALYFTVMR